MATSDDTKRVVADIDAETHSLLKERLEHGEMSELIREVAGTVAYGGGWDRSNIKERQLRKERQELRQLREQRRELDAKIETKEETIRELEHEREQMESEEERLEGALWSFEQTFRAGETRAVEENTQLQSIANEFKLDVEDVQSQLRERNPDVPECAFKPPALSRGSWDGFPPELVETPVDERESNE